MNKIAFCVLAICALYLVLTSGVVAAAIPLGIFAASACLFAGHPRVAIIAIWLGLIPAITMAGPLSGVANPLIDSVQPGAVSWIVGLAVSAFWAAATWLGGQIGIRFLERMNRNTLQEAAERYVNTIIDQLQVRYLGPSTPEISDLVSRGIDYIKVGNPGTVKQSKISDDRLAAYIEAAIATARPSLKAIGQK